uniref:Small subunit ribosomal protein S7 n=1 Tax=Heterorhabditis bacteriophora TaxID=37862 RepID=A0A1I7X7B6_HETBA
MATAPQITKKKKAVQDGVFKAELNNFLMKELAEDGYSGVESLRYKLVGGLAVRRACYGVLRFIMESNAQGCESPNTYSKQLDMGNTHTIAPITRQIIHSTSAPAAIGPYRNLNITERIDRIIRRQSEDNRRLTARNIHNEIKARMLSECLVNSTFDWTKVVFSNVSKINRFGSNGKKYIRRRPGEESMPK